MYMYTYIHRCLLALILMHWQQGSDIESKGDQLSSFAEYRIRTQGLWNRISIRLNARWQTDWSIEDQANKLEIYSPSLYDQQAPSPLDPTADMVSHLALAICFVGVNFDAPATIIGSDNGLSPHRHQTIIWSYMYADLLLTEPLVTYFNEIWIKIRTFSLMRMRLKLSSAKWPP